MININFIYDNISFEKNLPENVPNITKIKTFSNTEHLIHSK